MSAQQRSGHQRVEFEDLKQTFPLRDVIIRELGGRSHQKTWKCPFHDDREPSLSVFKRGRLELFKCHSPRCGKAGSVLDFVWGLHPELTNNGAATLAFLGQFSGTTIENFLPAPSNPRAPSNLSGGEHEAGGTSIEPDTPLEISLKEVYGRANFLLTGCAYEDLRDYATKRGWLVPPDQLYGTTPYPLGVGRFPRGRVSHYPLVGFPKLVRTERLAFLLGREEQFERDREICTSYRLRITPRVEDELWSTRMESNPPITAKDLKRGRHLCLPRTSLAVPGEIDSNEKAEVLVMIEGPGDALRLFNEAHATPLAASKVGQRWHITYVDSASALSPASFERRPRPTTRGDGKTRQDPVSFFDDYRLIIIIFDADEAGRYAANMARWLAHRQAPDTPVKIVALPNGQDVCDFFDSGKMIYDLTNIIAGTRATRGRDNPNEPPPEPQKTTSSKE